MVVGVDRGQGDRGRVNRVVVMRSINDFIHRQFQFGEKSGWRLDIGVVVVGVEHRSRNRIIDHGLLDDFLRGSHALHTVDDGVFALFRAVVTEEDVERGSTRLCHRTNAALYLEIEARADVMDKLVGIAVELRILVVFLNEETSVVLWQTHHDVAAERRDGIRTAEVFDGIAQRGALALARRVIVFGREVGIEILVFLYHLGRIKLLHGELHRLQRVAIIVVDENADGAGVDNQFALGIGQHLLALWIDGVLEHIKLRHEVARGLGTRFWVNHATKIAVVGVGQHGV